MTEDKIRKLLLGFGVTLEKVKVFAPIFTKYFNEYKFSDENILVFLSNILCETGSLTAFKENLNYSEEGLLKTFPRSFRGREHLAKEMAKQPVKIANFIYGKENKPELGGISPSDGSAYIGRGCLQTTGRANYTVLKGITGIDVVSNPELLEQPEMAVKSAVLFWNYNKLSQVADMKEVRKKVNGSYFHYEEKVKPNYLRLKKIYSSL